MKYDKNESVKKLQARHNVLSSKEDKLCFASMLLEKINVHAYHGNGCDGNPAKAWCERCTSLSIISEFLTDAYKHGIGFVAMKAVEGYKPSKEDIHTWLDELDIKYIIKK